jgi:hypothetical protein
MAPTCRSVAWPATDSVSTINDAPPAREIKLPPFEEDMPQAWFNQAEAYFRLHNVQDCTFWFYYVQCALSPPQKKLVWDILSIPNPSIYAYNLLKDRLLQLYEQGEKDRCRKFLATPPLSSRRPSELAADLLALCPQWDAEGDIIKYMFLFRLPHTMQALLGKDNTSTLQELAARADTLQDAEGAREGTVAAVVEELTVATAGVATTPSSCKRKADCRKKGAAKKRHGDGGGEDNPGPWREKGLCWSHFNFENKAHMCRPPCNWQEN